MSPIERSASGGGSGFTNPMTTAGDLIIENAVPAPARLAVGAAGQTLGVSGGLPAWVTPPGAEIGYTQITADVNLTDLAENTATALISPGALTFDGAPVMVEFFAEEIISPTGVSAFLVLTLFEGATEITRLAVFDSLSATVIPPAPGIGRYRFTPSAASHTYKLCGFVSSTAGTPHIRAGSGGTGGNAPAYLRFTKV